MVKFNVGDKVRDSNMSHFLEIIDIDEETNALPKYKLHDDFGNFWSYCFGWNKEYNVDEVLKYGEILTDDNFFEQIKGDAIKLEIDTRIRTIRYDNRIFYHKMVDGEVIKFKELAVCN